MAEKPDDDQIPPFEDNSSFFDGNSSEIDDGFKEDTEKVVKTFVYRRLTSQIDKEATHGDLELANIPSAVMNELRSADDCDNSNVIIDRDHDVQIQALGRSLADFGDEIQSKYHDTFADMIQRMNIASEESFAFDTFCSVSKKLFEQGINWGRIVALLCFGYEIAVHVIKQGTGGTICFLRKIVRYLVQFIQKYISSWIEMQGGWTGAISSINSDNWTIVKYVSGAAFLVVACYAAIRFARKP